MYIDSDTIMTAAALLTALITLCGALIAVYKWYARQNKQDVDIAKIKEEQCLLTYGILACLDGLQQLGCNHTVPETRAKIEKHINKAAHEQDG
ncbi:MAG: branched-chain amino acid ABC transporter permease [Lachnospiraceae bacterium]|nr:branched-chain amino acid ABC transporter permease [Lachnospiraceae bacterium]